MEDSHNSGAVGSQLIQVNSSEQLLEFRPDVNRLVHPFSMSIRNQFYKHLEAYLKTYLRNFVTIESAYIQFLIKLASLSL